MGPISNRPATAYAPRKVTESLDWRDGAGRQEKGRQPWQDVKPCDVNGAAKVRVLFRSFYASDVFEAESSTRCGDR